MIGYLDIPSGISGDMFLGCLVDAGWPIENLRRTVRALKLNIDEWSVEARSVMKGFDAGHAAGGSRSRRSLAPASLAYPQDDRQRGFARGNQRAVDCGLPAAGQRRGQGAWLDTGENPFP